MLRVSKVPPGDPTTEEYVGQNRFECLTCPYHFVINKRYFERKYMKKKEVEDILGGKDAWKNVDKTQGAFTYIGYRGFRANHGMIVQCPNEKCRNDEAYWYQLQIRSADEPMTAFYKVCAGDGWRRADLLTVSSVPSVRRNGENEALTFALHMRSLGAPVCAAIYPVFGFNYN
jgi:DNA-directed RNA polymerase III subunit RPC11